MIIQKNRVKLHTVLGKVYTNGKPYEVTETRL